jgi:solute carrier family 6 GABA transporter-like protein 1
VIGKGKNWRLPVFWAPLLRYISSPILAIILSLAYPTFQEVNNDPLYIIGFIVAHFLLLWIVVGWLVPSWFDVFVIHERRDDWKQPYAPNVLRETMDDRDDEQSSENGISPKTSEK